MGEGEAEGSRAGRLPRWTRQEILVLIQGKRMAESKVRRGRGGDQQLEPKWAPVSSYCRMHGVNGGPVQCRKRWSNLAGDFKKIKDWESSNNTSDSFWSMRNDLRRHRKLPGFFDKEVFDILDHNPQPPQPLLSGDGGGGAPAPEKEEEVEEEGARKRKQKEKEEDEQEGGGRRRLMDVLEKNANALSAHLEARKAHSDSLLSLLNKLADALLRISDKL